MQRGRSGTVEPAVNSEAWLALHSGGGAASVDPADEFFFRFFSNKVGQSVRSFSDLGRDWRSSKFTE